jgi:hypothetical protein
MLDFLFNLLAPFTAKVHAKNLYHKGDLKAFKIATVLTGFLQLPVLLFSIFVGALVGMFFYYGIQLVLGVKFLQFFGI